MKVNCELDLEIKVYESIGKNGEAQTRSRLRSNVKVSQSVMIWEVESSADVAKSPM